MSPRQEVRDRVLTRVRAACSARPATGHPGPLPDSLAESVPDPVELFSSRFTAAGGEVVTFADLGAAAAWASAWQAGFSSAAVSPWVPGILRPQVPAAQPDAAELAVTVARGAAAETGTLLLDSREGRRLQLLAPVHLIWVEQQAVYATLGAALEAVRGDRGAAVGLHSGPSKSADIGGVLVRGVHGPGRIVAAIVPVELLGTGDE